MAATEVDEQACAEERTASHQSGPAASEEGSEEHACEDAPEQASGEAGVAGSPQKDIDKGKQEYQNGNYAEAVKSWSHSLMSIKYVLDKGFYKDKPKELEEVYALELKTCLNISQGYLKTGEWANAVTYADRALAREPNNTKALYRKASALVQLTSFGEAAAVLNRLLQIEPDNPAAKTMLAEARRSAQVSDRRAKEMSRRMFSAVAKGDDPRVRPAEAETLRDIFLSAPAEALGLLKIWLEQCLQLVRRVLVWLGLLQAPCCPEKKDR